VARNTVTPVAARSRTTCHGAPAARVQAGGGLVEEQDARLAEQAHRQVEPADHATGVGAGAAVGHVGQIETLQQFGGTTAGLWARQVVQVAHQVQVLRAGEQPVHRGELAGDADRGAYRVGLGGDRVPGDAYLARVRTDQRRRDVHGRGLAGTVRAEQGEHGSRWYPEVAAVEHGVLAI
jgi:hypothetical protein